MIYCCSGLSSRLQLSELAVYARREHIEVALAHFVHSSAAAVAAVAVACGGVVLHDIGFVARIDAALRCMEYAVSEPSSWSS